MSLPSPHATERKPRLTRRRVVAGAVIVLAIAAASICLPRVLAWRGRQTAQYEIGIGALSSAQDWLHWSKRFGSGIGPANLLEAACFRRLGDRERWRGALQAAERAGAASWRIELETRLGALRWGELGTAPEAEMAALIAEGVPPDDAAGSLVYGLLTRAQPEKAKEALGVWAADTPQDAQVDFMNGVYCRWSGDLAGAESYYRSAVARQPRHELARAALAALLEAQNRFEEALQAYAGLAAIAPANARAKIGTASMLRQLGRRDEARAAILPLLSEAEPPAGLAIEMAQIEFESGNQEEAARWFAQVNLDGVQSDEALRAAASCFALLGKQARADAVFARIDFLRSRPLRLNDLQLQLAVNSSNQGAARELQQLAASPGPSSTGEATPARSALDQDRPQEAKAAELYTLHCSACHGENGDGNGRAARHLFPRPRDFRSERFRLASTVNGVPTPSDLETLTRQGMPGTTMRSFEDLTDQEHSLLAAEVMRLAREGVREQYVRFLRSEGDEVDERDVQEAVDLATTPGEAMPVPPIGPAGPRAVSSGKEAYLAWGCAKCHGDDGTGAAAEPLYDDQGRPTIARDLVHDLMRGGPSEASLYLRIRLGMPGTPHPACSNVPERELLDLVQFCRSLAREPRRLLTSHEQLLAASIRPPATTAAP